MSIQIEPGCDLIHEEDDITPRDVHSGRSEAPRDVQSGQSEQSTPRGGASNVVVVASGSDDADLEVTDEAPTRKRMPKIRGRTMILRTRETFHNRWPFAIGVAEIGFGFLALVLGVLEVMVIPLAMDTDPGVRFTLQKSNCFGVGIWTGIMLILTGALAVRASLARRATTVYRFYLITTVTLLVYIVALILLIVGYSSGWTPDTSPGEATAIASVHTINAVAVFIGFLLALVAFIQYYEDVFCGELQLCRRLGKIFCPCCCPTFTSDVPLLPCPI